MTSAYVALLFLFGTSSGALITALLLRKKKLVPPHFVRLGGRMVDEKEFSPEMFEKIRAEYNFAPPAKAQHLAIVDLTSTCALQHASRERIAVFGRNFDIVNRITMGLPKSRAELNCTECGKLGALTSKSIVWQGSFAQWDGAL